MTQPPQQPGPFGQDPQGQQPGQFGQQPPQFGQPPPQTPYGQQPAGGYGLPAGTPAGPPKKRNTGVIVAVVIGAVLVLGGGGTGIFLLTSGDDTPNNAAANSSSPNTSKPNPSSGAPRASNPSEAPPTSGAEDTPPTSGGEVPPTTGGGGGGGAEDAQILAIAEKYALAVTKQDEAGAKSVTCAEDTGLLYSSAGKVEVTGKPQMYTEDTASVPVKITIEQAEPFEDLPLFMEKKGSNWCVS